MDQEKKLLRVASEFFGMPESLIISESRKDEIVKARECIVCFAYNILNFTLENSVRIVNRQHHTTAKHLLKKIQNYKDINDPAYYNYKLFEKRALRKIFGDEIIETSMIIEKERLEKEYEQKFNDFKNWFKEKLIDRKGMTINETLINKICTQ